MPFAAGIMSLFFNHRCLRRGAVAALALVGLAGVGQGQVVDNDNCLFCHQYAGLSRYDEDSDQLHLFYVSPDYTHHLLGPHARLSCTDCHVREEVAVVPHEVVSKVNCTQTCHLADPQGLERRFSHENVALMLNQSVHTGAALSEVEFANGPLLDARQSQCLYCHDEPLFRQPSGMVAGIDVVQNRAFDRCDVCHAEQVPVDVRYYLKHIASRLQPARPPLELAQVCAVCHSDPKFREQHELPDTVASFVRSFHGKAALLGDNSTADCLSCHVSGGDNAHLMLPPSDPASSVSAVNVGDTCRSTQCHPGATPALSSAGVHLNLATARGTFEFALAFAFIVLTLLTYGPSMTIVCLELFQIVVGREAPHSHEHHRLTEAVLADPVGRRRLERFTPNQRVQHWLLVIFFALLALTGFPMKFADEPWARAVVAGFGGLSVARLVHHWAGIALVLGFVYHVLYVLYTLRLKAVQGGTGGLMGWFQAARRLPMFIWFDDLMKMNELMMYLLFLRKEPPSFHRFSIKEKFEYIGVAWGTTLLGITGAMLWGEQFFSHLVSGRIFNIALIMHTYEAFLAIIHVGILHIINVIFQPNVFPLSLATITGSTPAMELAHGHSEQVEEVARELGIAVSEGGPHHG